MFYLSKNDLLSNKYANILHNFMQKEYNLSSSKIKNKKTKIKNFTPHTYFSPQFLTFSNDFSD